MALPKTKAEFEAALRRLPDPARRAPDVTASLLDHGSLEDGSPTLTALELVMPQFFAFWHGFQRLRGAPFRTVGEYQAWQLRTQKIWRAPSFTNLLPEKHLEAAFRELDVALKAVNVGLIPRPDSLSKQSIIDMAIQPRGRMGHFHLATFPTTLVCPACFEGGGGGRLPLFQFGRSHDWRFICDEDEAEFEVSSNPWQQTSWRGDLYTSLGNEWWKQATQIPFSPLGSDWPRAERLLLQALSAEADVLPKENHRLDYSIRTVRLAEPLGRWQDTLWRVYLMVEDSIIFALTPIGSEVPPSLLERAAGGLR